MRVLCARPSESDVEIDHAGHHRTGIRSRTDVRACQITLRRRRLVLSHLRHACREEDRNRRRWKSAARQRIDERRRLFRLLLGKNLRLEALKGFLPKALSLALVSKISARALRGFLPKPLSGWSHNSSTSSRTTVSQILTIGVTLDAYDGDIQCWGKDEVPFSHGTPKSRQLEFARGALNRVLASCERHGSWEWHCRHSTSDTRTQSTDADTIGRHKGVRATSQSVTTLLLIHAMDDGRSGGRDFAQIRRSGGRLVRITINCDEST